MSIRLAASDTPKRTRVRADGEPVWQTGGPMGFKHVDVPRPGLVGVYVVAPEEIEREVARHRVAGYVAQLRSVQVAVDGARAKVNVVVVREKLAVPR